MSQLRRKDIGMRKFPLDNPYINGEQIMSLEGGDESLSMHPSYAMIETVFRAFDPSSLSPSITILRSTMSLSILFVNSFQASISLIAA